MVKYTREYKALKRGIQMRVIYVARELGISPAWLRRLEKRHEL